MTDSLNMGEAIELLNDLLVQAEDRFREMGLGVIASVPLNESSKLIFRKNESEWCLLVEPEHGDPKRIQASSLKERVQAAYALEPLEEAIEIAAGERFVEVRRAIDEAKKFLARRGPW